MFIKLFFLHIKYSIIYFLQIMFLTFFLSVVEKRHSDVCNCLLVQMNLLQEEAALQTAVFNWEFFWWHKKKQSVLASRCSRWSPGRSLVWAESWSLVPTPSLFTSWSAHNGGLSKGSVTEAGLERRTVPSPAIWRETLLTPMSEGSTTLPQKKSLSVRLYSAVIFQLVSLGWEMILSN